MLGDDLHGLAKENFNEADGHEEGMDFDPDWLEYQRLESSGWLRMIAARYDEELVGFATMRLHPALMDKKKNLCVVQDIYIDKSHRNLGAFFLKEIERIVRTLPVNIIIIATRGGSSGDLLQWLGYSCNEWIWSKSLGA